MASDLSHDAPPGSTQQQALDTGARPVTPQPGGHTPPPAAQQQALDPGALPVIHQSAARLARNENAFVRQLHYDVTGLIPDSAVYPEFDMWVFCERMVQALLWAALTDQPPHVVVDTLRQVGARNWYEGFPDAQYVSVAHALVQTVHYLSGNDWSASTGSAWITYFMWVRPHLVAGAQAAREAAAQQAAAQRAAAERAAAERAAAEQQAPRVEVPSRDPRAGRTRPAGDASRAKGSSLLDDDDDEDVGYGQIMVSMTRNQRREPPRHHPS